GADAGDLEWEPKPECPEMAGKLGGEVPGRGADIVLRERADIVPAGAERVGEDALVAGEDGAGAVREEQGLVRVERDRVGPLQPGKRLAPLPAQFEESSVGAIDMEPGAVPLAQVGDGG